jgi:hypothetical protein
VAVNPAFGGIRVQPRELFIGGAKLSFMMAINHSRHWRDSSPASGAFYWWSKTFFYDGY